MVDLYYLLLFIHLSLLLSLLPVFIHTMFVGDITLFIKFKVHQEVRLWLFDLDLGDRCDSNREGQIVLLVEGR